MAVTRAGRLRRRGGPVPWIWIGIGTLCLVALGLRLAGMHQDLFGDELFTFDDVHHRSLVGVVERVRDGYEDNPPLFFLLAWGFAKIGDPTVWIRVPSLVLGTALVPLVYLLGRRTIGWRAGVCAAAIVALAPFLVFYAQEARAYATLTFLSALSTLLLLRATEHDRGRDWLAYAVCVCAILYTHYTGIFVLVAQSAWCLWFRPPSRVRLVLASLAAVVGYVPWLVTQLTKDPTYTKLPALSPHYVLTTLAQALPGHPLEPPRSLPGAAWLASFAAALAIGAALLAFPGSRPRPGRPDGEILILLTLLALATPVGMIMLSSGAHNVLLPRGLSASLPAAVLLVAVALSAPRAPLGPILIGASLMILTVTTVRSLHDPPRDNGFRHAAEYIEARKGPADGVVYTALYHHPPHPLAGFLSSYLSDDTIPVGDLNVNDRSAWRRATHGGHVFVVLQPIIVFGRPLALERRAGPGGCFGLRQRKVISRSPPLLLGVYTVRPGGTLCARLALLGNALDRSPVRLSGRSGMRSIAPWFGHRVPVAPRTVKGAVHRMSTTHGRLVVEGAVDPRDAVPSWVVVFRGRHLVAAGVPDSRRPDLLKARHLPVNAIHFRVSGRPASPLERADTQHLKVFAIGPHRAFALGR